MSGAFLGPGVKWGKNGQVLYFKLAAPSNTLTGKDKYGLTLALQPGYAIIIANNFILEREDYLIAANGLSVTLNQTYPTGSEFIILDIGVLQMADCLSRVQNGADIIDKSAFMENLIAATGFKLKEQAAPATPENTRLAVYADANGKLRTKDDGGVVRAYSEILGEYIVSSNVANYDLALPSDYVSFDIAINDIMMSANGNALAMRVSTNNGVSFDSGTNEYHGSYVIANPTAGPVSNDAVLATYSFLTAGLPNSNAALVSACKFQLWVGAAGASVSTWHGTGMGFGVADSLVRAMTFAGSRATSSKVTNLRFFPHSGGNIARMRLMLVGYKY